MFMIEIAQTQCLCPLKIQTQNKQKTNYYFRKSFKSQRLSMYIHLMCTDFFFLCF